MKPPLRRFVAGTLGLAILGYAAVSTPVSAQDTKPRADLLVDTEWLAEHYQDPGMVLIHFGPEEDYAKGHIPGAVHMSFADISRPHDQEDDKSLVLEIPDHTKLQDVLRSAGIDDDSRVIVYWSSEWVTPTSRMMLTLDYAGLGGQSMMLDGGFEAWTAAGLPVTDTPSPPGEGTFTMKSRDDLIVSAEWVQEHAGDEGIALVDARSAAYYDGVKDSEAGSGHIPGAVNVDWRSLIDKEPTAWRSAAELTEIFARAGVEPGDTIVGYCHVGQYATAMLFAARTLGYDVRLYDGSMQDWGAIKHLPLEESSAGRPAKEGAGG